MGKTGFKVHYWNFDYLNKKNYNEVQQNLASASKQKKKRGENTNKK